MVAGARDAWVCLHLLITRSGSHGMAKSGLSMDLPEVPHANVPKTP